MTAVVAVQVVAVVAEPFVRRFGQLLLKAYMLMLVFERPLVVLWHNL